MFSCALTSARPLGVVKNLASQARAQHHPRGPADVNAKKNMFDPYIETYNNLPVIHVNRVYLSLSYMYL